MLYKRLILISAVSIIAATTVFASTDAPVLERCAPLLTGVQARVVTNEDIQEILLKIYRISGANNLSYPGRLSEVLRDMIDVLVLSPEQKRIALENLVRVGLKSSDYNQHRYSNVGRERIANAWHVYESAANGEMLELKALPDPSESYMLTKEAANAVIMELNRRNPRGEIWATDGIKKVFVAMATNIRNVPERNTYLAKIESIKFGLSDAPMIRASWNTAYKARARLAQGLLAYAIARGHSVDLTGIQSGEIDRATAYALLRD